MVTTVLRRFTVVRAKITINFLMLNPCINPPIVAPKKSIKPAFDIQPNLKVESNTGR